MPRPKDADSARTYDTILSAAEALLTSVAHPDGLSIRKVAAAADVSVGTVQYYFGSKSDLLEACLDGHYQRLEEVAGELATQLGELSPPDVLPHVARTLFRWLRGERALVRLRIATNSQRGELHPRRQMSAMRGVMDAGASALATYIELDPPTTRLAMLSLSSVAHRLVLLSDSELETLTSQTGDAMHLAVEDYFVQATIALLSPSE